MNVRMRGAGVSKSAQTNASGVASAAVRPRSAGRITVAASELNVAACRTTRRVAAARRGGTGVAGTGTGGGGAALSGRVR
jgi:hypothetical protein